VRYFGESMLTHRKDRWAGQPFVLEPWQYEKIILPIYGAVDRAGTRRFDKALIGLPRWNGKDEIAALLCLHHLFLEPVHDGECYAVAQNKIQAAILFETARNMVNANPLLRAACDVYRREIVVRETGCIFRCLPHDADAAQGFHMSLCVIDELHVHRTRAMIDAMLSGAAGRRNPLLIAITTAGVERRGVWWEILEEWRQDPSAYVYWHAARDSDDIEDRAVWRAANPASWITMERLEKLFRTLPRTSFERYHLNRAPTTSMAMRAFSWKEWRGCQEPPLIKPEEPCVVTVDGANKGDCFAIVVDRRDEEGTHHVESYIYDEPPPDTGYYDLMEIEEFLSSLWQTRNVVRMACDPNRLLLLMQRLEREHGIPVEEFNQTNTHMCPASATLRELVRTGRVRAGRGDSLRDHILNAVEMPREPIGWRIGKGDRADKIDGAIALAMAVFLAEAEVDAGPSFAATAGIRTITSG
jgi:phage terminase large subunit-like protein